MAANTSTGAGKPAAKHWTVMVYLAGDNNLDAAGVTDLQEMKSVGSTDLINVIAQFDRLGSKRTTKRYFLRKGGTLEKDAVASLGETNMGDPKVLQDFLQWGFRRYPAQHYLVVLWNHGAGWDDEDIYRTARKLRLSVRRRDTVVAGPPAAPSSSVSIRRLRVVGGTRLRRALFNTAIHQAIQPGPRARAIAFDDTSKDFLDNIEIKKVLGAAVKTLGRKIDILGMDACLMSMAEVGYQIRDSVHYTVGSEEVEPGDGWPYHKILNRLAKSPNMTPQVLSKTIVQEYLASYGASSNVTQSACDLTQSSVLARAISRLARTLMSNLDDTSIRSAIIQARAQVQSYEVAEYIDLYDFCALLDAACNQAEVSATCAAVMSALDDQGYVVISGYKGGPMQQSRGCSIYFPRRTVSPLYGTLDFTKQTAWDDFVVAYLSRLRSTGRDATETPATRAPQPIAAKGPKR